MAPNRQVIGERERLSCTFTALEKRLSANPYESRYNFSRSFVTQPDGLRHSRAARAFPQHRHGSLRSEHLQDLDGESKDMSIQVELLVAAADIAIALLVAIFLPMPSRTSD